MGTEKAKPQTAIIVAGITVLGTLGASLFANWDKVFPPKNEVSTTTTEVETSTTSTTPESENIPNDPSAITNDVGRFWSSEEDITAEYLVDIELKVNSSKISGTLQSFNQAGEDQSPLLSLVGELDMDQAVVEIYDQQGEVVGKAELTVASNTLTLNVLESEGIVAVTVPEKAVLYPIDGEEF